MSNHHRKPKSRGGGNGVDNISIVSSKEHKAWHTMFRNMLPHQIADKINNVWLDPNYKFIVVMRSDHANEET